MPDAPEVYGLLFTLGLGLAIAESAAVVYTYRSLRRPPRRTYANAIARGVPGDPAELSPALPFREWSFRSRGIELPVWDIQGLAPHAPAVIVTHGWGESRVTDLSRLSALARHFSRVVSWDLPGHGAAPGSCDLGVNEPADLVALLEQVGSPSVLYGFSMGAGIAIAAGARAADAAPLLLAIIAEAPYRVPRTPAGNLLRLLAFPRRPNLDIALAIASARLGRGANFGGFDRARLARSLRVPLLVIQGDADLLCPPDEALTIARSAPRSTYLSLPACEHLDVWTAEPHASAAHAAIATLLSSLNPTAPQRPQ